MNFGEFFFSFLGKCLVMLSMTSMTASYATDSEHYCFNNVDKVTCLGAFFPGGEKYLAHKFFFDFVYYCERRNYTLTHIDINYTSNKAKYKGELL